MKQFVWQQVGRLMAWGGEHIVRHYGTDHVIKFSLFDRYLWKHRAREKAEYDISVSYAQFGPYLLPTELVVSEDGVRYAKLQPKIVGRKIRKSDMKDSYMRKQLQEIRERRHGLLVRESDIDLMGGMGFITGSFANIFVLPGGTLRIIDSLIIFLPWRSPLAPLVRFIRHIVSVRQDVLFFEYLGDEETIGQIRQEQKL